jgi:hypothetical protein
MLFAWFMPLDDLADLTSRLTLVVFAVVNLSLAWIKRRGDKAPDDAFVALDWVPWADFVAEVGWIVGLSGRLFSKKSISKPSAASPEWVIGVA